MSKDLILLCFSALVLMGAVLAAAPREAGAMITQRLSVTTSMEEGNGQSTGPTMAGDGSLVVFASEADNLSPEQSPGIYLRNVATRSTGWLCEGAHPALSAEGNRLAYWVPDGSEGDGHVFVRNLDGSTVLQADAGLTGDRVGPPSISGDGRYVVFAANASPGGTQNIYLYTTDSQTLERVSNALSGGGGSDADCDAPVISDNGATVAFRSSAGNLVAGVGGGVRQIYALNIATGQITLASQNGADSPAASDCSPPGISGDGRVVAFSSGDDALVAGDSNGVADTFACTLDSGLLEIVSATDGGADGPSAMHIRPALSSDGDRVAFVSSATNLVENDTNGFEDAFIRSREDGVTRLASQTSDGLQSSGPTGHLDLSDDGASLVYQSTAFNLVYGDANGVADVFLWDSAGLYNNPAFLGMAAATTGTISGAGASTDKGGSLSGTYAVNTATLNMALKRSLYKMKTLGPTIEINLYYNAKQDNAPGEFGNGWSLENDCRILPGLNKNEAILKKGDGSETVFSCDEDLDLRSELDFDQYPLELKGPPGCQDRLELYFGSFGGGGAHWTLHEKATRLEYWFSDNTQSGFSRVERIQDSYGNGVFFNREYEYNDYFAIKRVYLVEIAVCHMRDDCDPENGCPDQRVIRFVYGEEGDELCVTRIETPEGDPRSITLAHDDDRNLTQLTDMAGYITTYAYDGDNYLTKTTTDGKSVLFSWVSRGDGAGKRISSVTDGGSTVTFVSSEGGVTKTTAEGKETHYESNAQGLTTKVSDTNGALWSIDYQDGLPALITGATGLQQTMTYDGEGRITGRTVDYGSGKQAAFAFSYGETTGNLTSYTTPDGVFALTYDAKNYLTSVTKPLGESGTATTTNTYNEKGRLESTENANGDSRQYTYDDYGNILTSTDEAGQAIHFEYDTMGRCTRITDQLGNVKTLTHDNNDRLTQITYDSAPGSPTYSWTYDAFRATAVTDENGHVTTVERNPFGMITRKTLPAGNTISYRYDADNRRIAVTDGLGNTSWTSYNAAGRPEVETDPLGHTVQRTYDAEGNLETLTDQEGNVTAFHYDATGKRIETDHAGGGTVTYDRDSMGRIIKITNARGQTIDMTHDADGRTISKVLSAGFPDYTFSYDGAGNLLSGTVDAETFGYTYTPRKELASIDNPGGNDFTFSYDAAGNLERITYPGGLHASYAYDTFNRVPLPGAFKDNLGDDILTEKAKPNRVTRIDFDGKSVVCQYDAAAQLTRMTRSNGTVTTLDYDPNGRMTSIVHKTGSTTIGSMAFTYDAAERPLKITTSGMIPPSLTTGITHGAFSYNKLDSWGGGACSYDSDGNLTRAPGFTGGEYSPDNQLYSITLDGAPISFTYDPNGMRKSKKVNGVTTRYHYDRTGRLLLETSYSGVIRARYFYIGPTLCAMKRDGSTYFYHFDRVGNTIALTNGAGEVVASYAYEPYGMVTADASGLENPFTYGGAHGVMDDGGGLFYMKNRYYYARTGCFMQRDPALFEGSINLYDYAKRDPLSYIDPEGDIGFFGGLAAVSFVYGVYKSYEFFKKWSDKNMKRHRKSMSGREDDLINAEFERKSHQKQAHKEGVNTGYGFWKNSAGAATGLGNEVIDAVDFSQEVYEDATSEDEQEEEVGWW